MPTAPMPHHHASTVVASALAVSDFGEGEFVEGFAFPEVVVDGSAEMADTGGAGLVGPHFEAGRFAYGCGGGGVDHCILGGGCGAGGWLNGGCVGSADGGEEGAALGADGSYSWL